VGNILLAAGAGLRDIDPLAVTITAVDLDKNVDGNGVRAA
jgi:hypothetical protein